MKSTILLLISFCFSIMLQAQVSKTANVTAGNLKTVLTADELITITSLTLTGTIDARDFKTMRDEMPVLAEIDLSQVVIGAYSGEDGTIPVSSYYYENEIPYNAFYLDITSTGEPSLFTVTKTSLITVSLPLSVTKIGEDAFKGCSGLISVMMPSSVTTIDWDAFSGCSGLTSITIPSSVKNIISNAFNGCTGLTSIYSFAETTPRLSHHDAYIKWECDELFFCGLDKTTCILYVPLGSKELYASAEYWSIFKHIVENPWYLFSSSILFLEANEGSSATTDISSNATWTVNSDQTWLTVSPTSGTGDTTLIFTAKANTSGISREATVIISAEHIESQLITVKQWAATTDANKLAEKSTDFICYPNPFNSVTTISWQLAENSKVTLKVLDIVGRTVATLVDEQRPQGKYETQFNAATLPKGIYFCKLKAGEFIQTRKMNILK